MKLNRYTFQVGNRVTTKTGLPGRVVARFRSPMNKNLKGYVVHLDKPFVSPLLTEPAHLHCFAEHFLFPEN